MSKIALITGISGQDGTYLTELLLSKNYNIHGFVRKDFKNKNLQKSRCLLRLAGITSGIGKMNSRIGRGRYTILETKNPWRDDRRGMGIAM